MRRTDADGLFDFHFNDLRRDVRDVLGDATIATTSGNQPDPQYQRRTDRDPWNRLISKGINLLSRICTGWNQLDGWLRQVEGLRRAG